MRYRVSSSTNDIRTFTDTGYICNIVHSRTCRRFAGGTVGLGSLSLIYSLYVPLIYRIDRQHFPEPFLWDTFYHLVKAAVAMRKGPQGGGWDFEIVHRDLKPSNGMAFPTDYLLKEQQLNKNKSF